MATTPSSKPRTPARASAHPLVGYYAHTFDPLNRLEYQVKILAVGANPDVVLAQMFSAIDGHPTEVRAFPLRDTFGWTLYADADAWRDGYDREVQKLRAH